MPIDSVVKMDNSIKEDALEKQAEDVPSSPITFESMGIPKSISVQETAVGNRRPLSDITKLELTYLALMILSIFAVIGFTIARLCTVSRSEADFTFSLILLVQTGFSLVYLVDGVLRERPSEMLILTIATVVIVIYLVLNYVTGIETTVKLIRMVVAIALSPFLMCLGIYITRKYHLEGKLIFKTVGASPVWQGMMKRLLAFQDFLKFDFQLGVTLLILILVSGLSVSTRDIIVLAVGGPLTVIRFLIGLYSMPVESKPLAIIFAVLSIPEVGYIGYRLYSVSEFINAKGGLASATIICGTAALGARVIVMILFVVVFKSFGKGLPDQIKSMKENGTKKTAAAPVQDAA